MPTDDPNHHERSARSIAQSRTLTAQELDDAIETLTALVKLSADRGELDYRMTALALTGLVELRSRRLTDRP